MTGIILQLTFIAYLYQQVVIQSELTAVDWEINNFNNYIYMTVIHITIVLIIQQASS